MLMRGCTYSLLELKTSDLKRRMRGSGVLCFHFLTSGCNDSTEASMGNFYGNDGSFIIVHSSKTVCVMMNSG